MRLFKLNPLILLLALALSCLIAFQTVHAGLVQQRPPFAVRQVGTMANPALRKSVRSEINVNQANRPIDTSKIINNQVWQRTRQTTPTFVIHPNTFWGPEWRTSDQTSDPCSQFNQLAFLNPNCTNGAFLRNLGTVSSFGVASSAPLGSSEPSTMMAATSADADDSFYYFTTAEINPDDLIPIATDSIANAISGKIELGFLSTSFFDIVVADAADQFLIDELGCFCLDSNTCVIDCAAPPGGTLYLFNLGTSMVEIDVYLYLYQQQVEALTREGVIEPSALATSSTPGAGTGTSGEPPATSASNPSALAGVKTIGGMVMMALIALMH